MRFQWILLRLIRIPDKGYKSRRSLGVRINISTVVNRVVPHRKERKEVRFCKKETIREIPIRKCWKLRDTDLNIEFTYGPAEERIFIGHNDHVNIYCVLPPRSLKENLQELLKNMLWECAYSKNGLLLEIQSPDDVRILLSIFLLAYWSKIEVRGCDVVNTIHQQGVQLGAEDFGYPDSHTVNKHRLYRLVNYKQESSI